MFDDIIKSLKEKEKEIEQLKTEKARAEIFLALVVEKAEGNEVDMDDAINLSSKNVRVVVLDGKEPNKIKVIYQEESKEEVEK